MRQSLLLLFVSTGIAVGADNIAVALPHFETSLTLEKENYLVGEPITLTFKAKYTGPSKEVEVSSEDPYNDCSLYHLTVTPDSSDEPKSGPPCSPLFQIHSYQCLISKYLISRNVPEVQRVLLNRLHDFTQPGAYVVQVTRSFSYVTIPDNSKNGSGLAVETFRFSVTPPASMDDLNRFFLPYLEMLASGPRERRDYSELVIASLPTPFLEPYLLGMLSKPISRGLAVTGLGRLNTETAHAALFEIIKADNPDFESQFAIKALQNTGDAAYGLKLLNLIQHTGKPERSAVPYWSAWLKAHPELPIHLVRDCPQMRPF